MGHSAEIHETLEDLDELLDSFDHPEKRSTDQGRAKASNVVHCSMTYWISLTRTLAVATATTVN